MLPDAEKDFLCNVLGFGCVAEHPASQPDHSREMTANEFGRGALVAAADTTNQFFVRIPHGLGANSANRSAAPMGQAFKAALLSTVMHPAAAFAERYLLFCGAVNSRAVDQLLCMQIKRREGRLPSRWVQVSAYGGPQPGTGCGPK